MEPRLPKRGPFLHQSFKVEQCAVMSIELTSETRIAIRDDKIFGIVSLCYIETCNFVLLVGKSTHDSPYKRARGSYIRAWRRTWTGAVEAVSKFCLSQCPPMARLRIRPFYYHRQTSWSNEGRRSDSTSPMSLYTRWSPRGVGLCHRDCAVTRLDRSEI